MFLLQFFFFYFILLVPTHTKKNEKKKIICKHAFYSSHSCMKVRPQCINFCIIHCFMCVDFMCVCVTCFRCNKFSCRFVFFFFVDVFLLGLVCLLFLFDVESEWVVFFIVESYSEKLLLFVLRSQMRF